MDFSSGLKTIWKYLGLADKTFLLVVAAYLISGWMAAGNAARLLLLVAIIITGFWTGIKWTRIGIRKVIWRLRNRLVVAYLFIALVPILLVGIFGLLGGRFLAGQIAVYLVSSELERRMFTLNSSAESLALVPAFQRERTWQRTYDILAESFPTVDVVILEGNNVSFPSEPIIQAPPSGWGEINGIVVREDLLYAWARAVNGKIQVTLLAPLTNEFLEGLAPGIGDVTILEFPSSIAGSSEPQAMSTHGSPSDESRIEGTQIPAPRNRFDFSFKWATGIPVAVWDTPPLEESALLSVHTRFSAVLGVIFSRQAEAGYWLALLYLVAVVFLIVELISLVIGVSITRTVTSAVHNLYEGTERVREGDFSHRIVVKGYDQIAVVSGSFNRMTENLERLLEVAKEKERMEAELEIAREVQGQLYPKSVPKLSKLELRARCNPARTVSGDYYDYQPLRDHSAVLAIGDVAGKGISAALLMATLQSSLRTQVRASLEKATAEGEGYIISTSQFVGHLNEQLFADTSPEKYATFFFSVYDDDTGMLTYTNAGHLPPLLFRNGEATRLDVNGMVVGAFPFAQFEQSHLQLESGDLLLGYTDGITEPENEYDEMFGEQRLIETVTRNAHLDVEQIIEAVMNAVGQWTGSPELQDDMTILLARRL